MIKIDAVLAAPEAMALYHMLTGAPPPESEHRILAALHDMERRLMSKLTDLVTKELADNAELRAELGTLMTGVDAMIAASANQAQAIKDAVTQALADANVADDAAAAVLQATDDATAASTDAIKAEAAKIAAALAPPPPADSPPADAGGGAPADGSPPADASAPPADGTVTDGATAPADPNA